MIILCAFLQVYENMTIKASHLFFVFPNTFHFRQHLNFQPVWIDYKIWWPGAQVIIFENPNTMTRSPGHHIWKSQHDDPESGSSCWDFQKLWPGHHILKSIPSGWKLRCCLKWKVFGKTKIKWEAFNCHVFINFKKRTQDHHHGYQYMWKSSQGHPQTNQHTRSSSQQPATQQSFVCLFTQTRVAKYSAIFLFSKNWS